MIDRLPRSVVSRSVREMMIEKIIVVAPTTAVPMSTGLAVALKVLPAPSFSSSIILARDHCGSMPKSSRTAASMPGIDSIRESS